MGAMKEVKDEGVEVLIGMPIGGSMLWDGMPGETVRVIRAEDPEGPYWELEVLDAGGEVIRTETHTDPDAVFVSVWSGAPA